MAKKNRLMLIYFMRETERQKAEHINKNLADFRTILDKSKLNIELPKNPGEEEINKAAIGISREDFSNLLTILVNLLNYKGLILPNKKLTNF